MINDSLDKLDISNDFIDIVKRGIEEKITDTEEKKIYLNIVKNNKDIFRILFIDNDLYNRIFNILVLVFGFFDVMVYLSGISNAIVLITMAIGEYFLIKAGAKDIVNEKSFKLMEEYIVTIEDEITKEVNKKETLSFQNSYNLDKEYAKINIKKIDYIPNIKRVLKKNYK